MHMQVQYFPKTLTGSMLKKPRKIQEERHTTESVIKCSQVLLRKNQDTA